MSADNWGICPRCKIRAKAAKEEAIQKAIDSYGKVSAEEYAKLQEEARALPSIEETLREDYESWIDENGRFLIDYSASCQECGFKHRFKHDVQLDVGE